MNVTSVGPAPTPLEVHGLRLRLDGVELLHGVDLVVPRGSRTALVGASGAGKTLTVQCLAGRERHAARGAHDLRLHGQVLVGGAPVLGVPQAVRPGPARVAVVAQDGATALNPLVRVGRQFAAVGAGVRAGGGAGPDVAGLLAAVGLDLRAIGTRFPGELSGGQRQRVCLALALACAAPLLVADEPTTALDPLARRAVLDLLARLTGGDGPALLLVTHDLAAAADICDHVAIMHAGTVVEHGPTARVLAGPVHPAARALVQAAGAS